MKYHEVIQEESKGQRTRLTLLYHPQSKLHSSSVLLFSSVLSMNLPTVEIVSLDYVAYMFSLC